MGRVREGVQGGWCLWQQVLISNKMPVMRSLFPSIQIDVM